jgi:hypothetical protein
MQKLATITDQYTDRLCPVGILPRVAKKLQHFATITDGYTDGFCPVGILQRVAKTITAFFHNHLWNMTRRYFAESCKKITAPAIITDAFPDGRGKSNVRVL